MPPAPPQLLLIDDDIKLSRLLSRYLHDHGFELTARHDGESGLAQAINGQWDLILLDGMLPKLDGFDVLQRLRERSRVPVLMLTARGDEADRIFGLDHGADDYLAKTASPRELVARIRALLRRSSSGAAAAATAVADVLVVGTLRIDPNARSARLDGRLLTLTPVEFDLLAALARQPGRLLTRAQLVERLRDREFDHSDRSIDVHITALRRKLDDDPRQPRYIRTVRGAGYLMLCDDDR
ncbi:MAG: response regulator transcription factor [Nevskia sp.]|uniref:response regulator transcription factor n=1 Tax=Nevskia sp. TaxID=1929292 RepID=UPI00403710FB